MSNANTKVPKFQLHLEDSTLEAHAKTYPEEMREPFLWLGGYVREKCHRNLDVLEAQMVKLGFKTTGGTISKIIQGRWQKNADGTEMDSPIMAENNFIQLVDALRKLSAREDARGKVPFVETGTWKTFRAYVDVRRVLDAVCKFGLVIGPTGSQKTSCAKYYCTLNNHGQCHHLEAPDTATMGKFITDLGAKFGVSVWAGTQAKRARISECVNETKTLIIDNIQRLYKENQGWNQPIFNYLQKLQDDTNCTIILMCVPEFELTLKKQQSEGYFEQFEGRCGGDYLVMDHFTPREDLLQIAEAFKLAEAKKNVGVLEKLSKQRGRIRIVFNVLQKAKRIAESENARMRLEHIEAVLPAVQEQS